MNLDEKIDSIIQNHLAHIKEDIVGLKADVEWLKKFQWLILATSVTALIVNIIK